MQLTNIAFCRSFALKMSILALLLLEGPSQMPCLILRLPFTTPCSDPILRADRRSVHQVLPPPDSQQSRASGTSTLAKPSLPSDHPCANFSYLPPPPPPPSVNGQQRKAEKEPQGGYDPYRVACTVWKCGMDHPPHIQHSNTPIQCLCRRRHCLP